jgi:hypothetical protein
MKRLHVFALAGALTLTVFTGAFAIMGMARGSTKPATPVLTAQVTPAAATAASAPQRWDD